MSSLEEKIKELEPAQMVIYGVVAVVAIGLIFSLFYSGSDEDEEVQNSEFAMPDDRKKVEEYNSKLDAYNQNNKERENHNSLEFDIADFQTGQDDDKAELDREIDSLLNNQKIEYTEKKPTQSTSRRTNRTTTTRNNNSNNNVSTNTRSNTKPSNENINNSFNDFFDSNPETATNDIAVNTSTDPLIYAVIHGSQTIAQNERVKLRLTRDALINGISYSKNSYVYATPTFGDNRVFLDITVINHKDVDISAYDGEDSGLGLNVKGAKILSEVNEEGQKDLVDDVDVNGIPIGSALKKVFQKKQQTQTATLINNARIILKPKK